MSLKLKVWHGSDLQIINMNRKETLADAARKVFNVFQIENVDLKNFRFRAYDNVAKLKLGVYDQFQKSLLQLNFKSYIRLTFDLKCDDEEFEAFDPNALILNIVLHQEGKDYDFKKVNLNSNFYRGWKAQKSK